VRDFVKGAAVLALCIAPSAAMNLWPGLSGIIWGTAAADGATVAKLTMQAASVIVMALSLVAMERARSWPKKLAALGLGLGLASLNFLNALELASHARDEVATKARGTINGTAALQRQFAILQKSRTELPQFIPATAAAVESAVLAVSAAEKSRASECEKRGPNCRDREADERAARATLAAVQERQTLTDRAAKLEGDMREIEAKLAAVGPAPRYEDPAAHRLAVILAMVGFDLGDRPAEKVAEYWPLLIAAMVEVLAMVGPYVLLGAPAEPRPRRSWRWPRIFPAPGKSEPTATSCTTKKEYVQEVAPAAAVVKTAVSQSAASAVKRCKSKPKPKTAVGAVRDWKDDHIVTRETDLKAGDALEHYREWCRAKDVEPVNQTVFGKELAALGVEKFQTPSKRTFYRGVGLRAKPALVVRNAL
jgi:hypothetical protein